MKHIRPVFGGRAAESITRRELVKWLDTLRPTIVNGRLFHLQPLAGRLPAWSFGWGITNEKISRNPLSGMRRKHEADIDRVRYLSLEEEEKLVEVLSKRFPDYVPLFILSANSGMRKSEQFRSRVGDFDPTTKMLAVHQQKDRNKPKVRYVPLSKKGAEAYKRL